ncbi:FecR family protein [Chitinophaga ginsengisegetis]|uniref:FecR family protein n=1 Tax=Chitinophaga ginsengisegetis TaxID=393003 RepID=A0A1T5PAR3_9BACT|nr:FecR domain-containing protein [Chitinophaga ginsengisegetis]SKD09478.1 FecR family protein [Chitinophaga ginsengisegetis]
MKDNIYHLIEKYLAGTITPAEEAQLMAWYQDHNQTDVEWPSENADEEEQVRLRMLLRMNQQINTPVTRSGTTRRLWYLSAAASVLLIVGFATYFYYTQIHRSTRPAVIARDVKDIGPGGNKAILTLANGDKVVLEEAKNGLISQQGNTSVNKTGSGSLLYNKEAGSTAASIVYNTLSTPYGGQYQMTLQDGTKVWLNAGSSLRFPASFPGNERNVILTGEAYFEVAKDNARPFFVTVNAGSGAPMTVRVLGTHFNINAYPDEQHNIVTLLEGAVKVGCGQANALLAPGKEAILNRTSGKINIKDGDTEGAVAWKNGYFLFENEKIESIMRQISRWYDVEVSYQGDVSGKAIGGSLSRSKNVSEVLNMLELTGTVHFKINGRRITVMP